MAEKSAEDFVAEADTGARAPVDPFSRKLLFYVAVAWSVFQIWIASPLPYMLADYIPLMNDTHTRSIHLAFAIFLAYLSFPALKIHLAFAIFLAYLSFPALKRSPRHRIPVQDWVIAIIGAAAASYTAVMAIPLSGRPGLPVWYDLVAAGIGLVCLLEATRRSLGPPLLVVALLFLSYVFFGHLAPDVIAWQGASFRKAMSHLWLGQEICGLARKVCSVSVLGCRRRSCSCSCCSVRCSIRPEPVITLPWSPSRHSATCVAGPPRRPSCLRP
jgi:TRAP-type uncharacterized transport system fused permease subunit